MVWKTHETVDMTSINSTVTIVSDSLFNDPELVVHDESGERALELLSEYGLGRTNLDYLPDDLPSLQTKIESDLLRGVDLVLLVGGTGVSKRDVTYEAVKAIIEKEVLGFGEQFRKVSYEKIGGFGLIGRAIAGVTQESVIVALPGSPNAVEDGVHLLMEFLGHVLQQIKGV